MAFTFISWIVVKKNCHIICSLCDCHDFGGVMKLSNNTDFQCSNGAVLRWFSMQYYWQVIFGFVQSNNHESYQQWSGDKGLDGMGKRVGGEGKGLRGRPTSLRALRHLMAQAAHWAPAPLFSLTLSVVPHWPTLRWKSLDMPAHKTKGTPTPSWTSPPTSPRSSAPGRARGWPGARWSRSCTLTSRSTSCRTKSSRRTSSLTRRWGWCLERRWRGCAGYWGTSRATLPAPK